MNEQHPVEKIDLIEGLGNDAALAQVEATKAIVKKTGKPAGLQVKSQLKGGHHCHIVLDNVASDQVATVNPGGLSA